MNMQATLPPAPPADNMPMSPGNYLRKRREAAGVTLERAALTLTQGITRPIILQDCKRLVLELESDERHVTAVIVSHFAHAFPLDPEIYDTLVANHCGAALPMPNICSQCACSFHDPCLRPIDDLTSGAGNAVCGWADGSATICTFCDEKQKAGNPESQKAGNPESQNEGAS